MTWTLNMRDNYEFEDVYYWGGLVFDSWMWELNYYGRAKHFKTRGQRGITVTWPKGYRFDIADARMLIEGRQPHFPECDLW